MQNKVEITSINLCIYTLFFSDLIVYSSFLELQVFWVTTYGMHGKK